MYESFALLSYLCLSYAECGAYHSRSRKSAIFGIPLAAIHSPRLSLFLASFNLTSTIFHDISSSSTSTVAPVMAFTPCSHPSTPTWQLLRLFPSLAGWGELRRRRRCRVLESSPSKNGGLVYCRSLCRGHFCRSDHMIWLPFR